MSIDQPTTKSEADAFLRLNAAEIEATRPLATTCTFEDWQAVFHAGGAELDLFVVESGGIEITNPAGWVRSTTTEP